MGVGRLTEAEAEADQRGGRFGGVDREGGRGGGGGKGEERVTVREMVTVWEMITVREIRGSRGDRGVKDEERSMKTREEDRVLVWILFFRLATGLATG
ncbi:hypothetical protein Scep_021332 [Stephania cephalantha]|uniref:Uncharacterized protein n=1 Tax=Stephania cephalantha TaxID=152367 RepID=A0AAP0HWS2_9MAGN